MSAFFFVLYFLYYVFVRLCSLFCIGAEKVKYERANPHPIFTQSGELSSFGPDSSGFHT
jgi:hypothetical protein